MRAQKLGLGITVLAAVSLMISGIMVFGVNTGDAAVYFPLNLGNTWIYKLSVPGSTNSSQQKIKVTDPENGNPRIIVYDPAGNPQVFITYVENPQGLFKAKEMAANGAIEYHPLWQVFGATVNIGTTWSWDSDDHKMKETAKVTATEKVTVPAGTFDTILIVCSGINQSGQAYSDKTWYAKGVGYVKDEITIGDKVLLSELTLYELTK